MIKSDKFPGDCLFFIFEQDFELYPGGKIPGSGHASGDKPPDRSDPSASSSAEVPHPRGQKRNMDAAPEVVPARSSAVDMVALVNAACRQGVGDIVWLGYNPKTNSGKPGCWNAPRVKFGTQLICLTKQGAGSIQLVMGTDFWKAQHIDMWLLKFCQDHRFSGGRCSYVFPPVGCFGSHDSECCPDKGARSSLWKEDYTAVGTRPSEDMKSHRSKNVYGMTEGGTSYCDLKCSLKDEYFSGQTGFWRTYVQLEVNVTDSTTKDTQLLTRRRRREHTNLKWRNQTDSPKEVYR